MNFSDYNAKFLQFKLLIEGYVVDKLIGHHVSKNLTKNNNEITLLTVVLLKTDHKICSVKWLEYSTPLRNNHTFQI